MFWELIGIEKSENYGFGVFVNKGGDHKYVSRVPTGKEKPKYRYLYSHPTRGIVHEDHMKEGSKFRHGSGKETGHYHVEGQNKDGSWNIKHDVTTDTRKVSFDQLKTLIHSGKHKRGENPNKRANRLMRDYKASLKHGSTKQQTNLLSEITQYMSAYPDTADKLGSGLAKIQEKKDKKKKPEAPKKDRFAAANAATKKYDEDAAEAKKKAPKKKEGKPSSKLADGYAKQYRKYLEGEGSFPKSRGRAGLSSEAMDAIRSKEDAKDTAKEAATKKTAVPKKKAETEKKKPKVSDANRKRKAAKRAETAARHEAGRRDESGALLKPGHGGSQKNKLGLFGHNVTPEQESAQRIEDWESEIDDHKDEISSLHHEHDEDEIEDYREQIAELKNDIKQEKAKNKKTKKTEKKPVSKKADKAPKKKNAFGVPEGFGSPDGPPSEQPKKQEKKPAAKKKKEAPKKTDGPKKTATWEKKGNEYHMDGADNKWHVEKVQASIYHGQSKPLAWGRGPTKSKYTEETRWDIYKDGKKIKRLQTLERAKEVVHKWSDTEAPAKKKSDKLNASQLDGLADLHHRGKRVAMNMNASRRKSLEKRGLIGTWGDLTDAGKQALKDAGRYDKKPELSGKKKGLGAKKAPPKKVEKKGTKQSASQIDDLSAVHKLGQKGMSRLSGRQRTILANRGLLNLQNNTLTETGKQALKDAGRYEEKKSAPKAAEAAPKKTPPKKRELKHHKVSISVKGKPSKGSTKWKVVDPVHGTHEYTTSGGNVSTSQRDMALQSHAKKHGIEKPVKADASFWEAAPKKKKKSTKKSMAVESFNAPTPRQQGPIRKGFMILVQPE